MWKRLRIGVLLLVLGLVASDAWFEHRRATDWRATLHVGIYPVAADGSSVAADFVARLMREQFLPIERFFATQARSYGVPLLDPVRIELFGRVDAQPPEPPVDAGALGIAWWSLRLRYYAAHAGRVSHGPAPQIRLFVLYHDPGRSPSVPHSLGLQQGHVGVVHVFATTTMGGSNNVVIAHELLHTLGAIDKYDLRTNAPLYPQGLGDLNQVPRYPQQFAEIMAGRRAVSATVQEVPETLAICLIGRATAAEINWIQH